MSLNCKNCGAKLKKDAQFCRVCGALVSTSQVQTRRVTPTPSTQNKCKNCGKVFKGSEKFCTSCGAKREEVTTHPAPTGTPTSCPHCGFSKNPPSSYYCINCGQPISNVTAPPQTTATEPDTQAQGPIICSECGVEAKSGSKFCTYCGGRLVSSTTATSDTSQPSTESQPAVTPAAQPEVEEVEPIPVPADVLASLMARGRQLTLEEEYAKNGAKSDQLLDELSKVAGDSDFKLEELIDTFINERSEQDRLEALHEKDEVSQRVFERLQKEYEEKLDKMDVEIQKGVKQLQGYQAQIKLDYSKTKEDLETLKARIAIGDDVDEGEKQQTKLTDKVERLNYALLATKHIIQKESTMRNGPLTRFEVTEKTLDDAEVTSLKPEPKEEPSTKPTESKPEPESQPAQPDAEAGKICTQCGRVTASDAKFCVHCGTPL